MLWKKLFKNLMNPYDWLTYLSWCFKNHRTIYSETWYLASYSIIELATHFLPSFKAVPIHLAHSILLGLRVITKKGFKKWDQVQNPDTSKTFVFKFITLQYFKWFPSLPFLSTNMGQGTPLHAFWPNFRSIPRFSSN